MSTRQEVIKGERWAFFATVTLNIGQLFLLFAFTRLVSKEAFAVMAIAGALAGLPQLILQTGLSHSLFSHDKDDQEQLSTLFWLHLALSVSISGGLILLAVPISRFYGGLFLKEIIGLLSITLIFGAVAALYRVLHLKALNYSFLALVDILAFLGSAVAAFLLALLGKGVFALVVQVVVRSVLECLLLFSTGRLLFLPSLHFSLPSVKHHLRFAFNHIGERISMWMFSQADVLLIGKLLEMEALGVYEVFRRLLSRPPAALGEMAERIALPLMARYRYRLGMLKKLYLNNISLMASVVFPVYIWLAISSAVVSPYLFGRGWEVHSGIFSLMALSIAFNSMGHPLDNLLVATGQIHRLLFWNLMYLPLLLLIIFWGSGEGLFILVGLMLALALFINNPAYYYLFRSVVPASLKEYILPIITPLVLVLMACILPVMLLWIHPDMAMWVLGTFILAVTYLSGVRKFQRQVWDQLLGKLF